MRRLFQQDLRRYPFWMLVGCILVNRTHWVRAKPVFEKLRGKFFYGQFSTARRGQLESILRPLGLHRIRSRTLKRFEREIYYAWPIRKASDLRHVTGVGRYAMDSWKIFVSRDLSGPLPSDEKLRAYVRYRRRINKRRREGKS